MNDRLIAQYFAEAERVALYGQNEERVLVADAFLALSLPRDHEAFDSRRVFASLPLPGETDSNCPGTSRHLAQLWQDDPRASSYAMRPTNLFRRVDYDHVTVRVFLPEDPEQRWVLNVQERFLKLLDEYGDLAGYTFAVAGPMTRLIVRSGDEQVAVIMPCYHHSLLLEMDDERRADAAESVVAKAEVEEEKAPVDPGAWRALPVEWYGRKVWVTTPSDRNCRGSLVTLRSSNAFGIRVRFARLDAFFPWARIESVNLDPDGAPEASRE